jgi:hypothetical protein
VESSHQRRTSSDIARRVFTTLAFGSVLGFLAVGSWYLEPSAGEIAGAQALALLALAVGTAVFGAAAVIVGARLPPDPYGTG